MIDTSTEAVKALMDGVTPSKPPHKWHVVKRYSFIAHKETWQVVWDVPNSMSLVLVADTGNGLYMGERDARFIAAARDLVPALAAERDRLAQGRDRLQSELWAMQETHSALEGERNNLRAENERMRAALNAIDQSDDDTIDMISPQQIARAALKGGAA